MKRKTVQEALQFVTEHPNPTSSSPVDMPAWELIARNLVVEANTINSDRGRLARTAKAQKILLDRLVGRRRAGTHPAQVKKDEVVFVDLTQGVLE